jgi:hypothetical protein
MRALLILPGCLLAVGCGITDPYQGSAPHAARTTNSSPVTTTTTASAPDAADPAPERGGTVPAAAQASQRMLADGSAAATPTAALTRYAQLEINWRASTLLAQQRQLAAVSLDEARAAALQAAASAARDAELIRSQVANRGQIIAITPGQGPAGGRWVLVTAETTTGTGDYSALPAAIHVTYAQVTRTTSGWVVSQWSPQN